MVTKSPLPGPHVRISLPHNDTLPVTAITALYVFAACFALSGCKHEEPALRLCRKAGEYVEAGELDAALDAAKQAVAAGPEDYRTWYTLGWVRSERQEYSEAEEAYRQAVALQPDSGMSHHGLGWVLQRQGRDIDAIPQLREAARLRPDVANVHVALGRSLTAVGNNADAIAAYDQAIDLDSDLEAARVGRAYSLFAMGNIDEALAAAKREANQEFSTPKLPFDRAQVMRGSGDLEGAIGQYRKSIEIDPDYVIARRELVYTLVAAGDVDSALKEAKELQGMVPANQRRWARSLVAWVLAYRGDVERALASIEGPPKPEWHPGTLGHVYALRLFAHQLDGAVEVARDEVDWHPDDPEAHGQLALSLALAGQWQEAQHQAEEAMAGHGTPKPITSVVLAYVLAKQGDTAAARRALRDTEEALGRDGRAIETLYVAGLAYRELGEIERSNELFQRAIDRWPKHPWSEKMRSMTWQCICEGADGLVYYSWQDLHRDETTPFEERWPDMKTVVEEVAEQIPVLLSVEPAPELQVEAPETVHWTVRTHEGTDWLFLVNGETEPARAVVRSAEERRETFDLAPLEVLIERWDG